jgi:predicted nucleotidyltransferase
MTMDEVDKFLQEFTAWAVTRLDIQAVGLVGSQARGNARVDSDVDLVIVADNPAVYLRDMDWTNRFGFVDRQQMENYGIVQSLRVWYLHGLEVEYGLTDARWVALPLDAGTRTVIEDGMRVLFERGNILSSLLTDCI